MKINDKLYQAQQDLLSLQAQYNEMVKAKDEWRAIAMTRQEKIDMLESTVERQDKLLSRVGQHRKPAPKQK